MAYELCSFWLTTLLCGHSSRGNLRIVQQNDLANDAIARQLNIQVLGRESAEHLVAPDLALEVAKCFNPVWRADQRAHFLRARHTGPDLPDVCVGQALLKRKQFAVRP